MTTGRINQIVILSSQNSNALTRDPSSSSTLLDVAFQSKNITLVCSDVLTSPNDSIKLN